MSRDFTKICLDKSRLNTMRHNEQALYMKTEDWHTSLSDNQYLTFKTCNTHFVRNYVVIRKGITNHVLCRVFCHVACSMSNGGVKKQAASIFFHPAHRKNWFIQNTGTLLPKNMAKHPSES